MNPQTLSNEIWEGPASEAFHPPSLEKFDERTTSYEHVTSINTQTTIIGASDSLKCKLLSDTYVDAAQRWYMGLPRSSITNYQELARKLVHQFAVSRHRKMSTTKLFNIRQGPLESLRDYLAHSNEATMKVVPPNQEMFMGVFHSGVKAG